LPTRSDGFPIISIENLGKRYTIRHATDRTPGSYRRLSEDVADAVRIPFRALASRLGGASVESARSGSRTTEEFWALRGVSFDVSEGEVLGIIGRNGAGKSTLLKILSRITEPSEGRVRVRGRVASLLEVGTGFHPELTGRENVYLNGAILGMTRAEINGKFAEIVSFAEVERFLDTPVKRYSSGMYVRLAFSVAAHLEPEMLVVDEVLAVGDAEFQKRCLGKMRNVARSEGRTVLFVSHNMQAIQSLCDRSVLLDQGRVVAEGPPRQVVDQYLARTSSHTGTRHWNEGEAPGDAAIRLKGIRVSSSRDGRPGIVASKDDCFVELEFIADTTNPGLCVGFDLANAEGTTVFRSYQTDSSPDRWPTLKRGDNRWRCTIPKGLLNAGTYSLSPRIGIHNVQWIVNLDDVLQFEVLLDHGDSPLWNALTESNRPGLIAPILAWEACADEGPRAAVARPR